MPVCDFPSLDHTLVSRGDRRGPGCAELLAHEQPPFTCANVKCHGWDILIIHILKLVSSQRSHIRDSRTELSVVESAPEAYATANLIRLNPIPLRDTKFNLPVGPRVPVSREHVSGVRLSPSKEAPYSGRAPLDTRRACRRPA